MKWIFNKERGQDDESALVAIKHALNILKENFFTGSALHLHENNTRTFAGTTVAMEMHTLLTAELMKLNCEFTIKKFCQLLKCSLTENETATATTRKDIDISSKVLFDNLNNPQTLLRIILEASVSVCWGKQLKALHLAEGNIVIDRFLMLLIIYNHLDDDDDDDVLLEELTITASDSCSLCYFYPVKEVIEFANKASEIVDELAQHCGLSQAAIVESDRASSPSRQQGVVVSGTESIRHALIGRLLSDAENVNVLKAVGEKDNSNWSNPIVVSSLISIYSFAMLLVGLRRDWGTAVSFPLLPSCDVERTSSFRSASAFSFKCVRMIPNGDVPLLRKEICRLNLDLLLIGRCMEGKWTR